MQDGQVRVRWELRGRGTNQKLEIVWEERNGPQRGSDPDRTFGFELIQRTLALELNGTVEMRFAESGLRCTITIAADLNTLSAPPSNFPQQAN